ncbi:MAG: O-antigen ligase family protein [Candidatus Omnitrophica bacterium]|nr:O-antigen ligase family protein [Candidatus Omnitrophota bacterium]
MDKNKIIKYCDNAIMVFLCLSIFCLPFSKAALESFLWSAIVIFVAKRILGYRGSCFRGMFPQTPLNKVLGIFCAVNVLSVIFSVNLGLSLRGLLGKEFKFLAIFFILTEIINSKERLRNILIAIVASAALIIADAWVQYFRGFDFLRSYQYSRLTASFSAANGLAAWLVMVIPLVTGVFLWVKVIYRKLRISLLVMIFLLFICLLLTYSRGAWLGIMLAGIFMSFYILKNSDAKAKIRYLSFIICLIIVFLLTSKLLNISMRKVDKVNFDSGQTVGERIKSIVNINRGASLVRLNLWKEALMIIRDYPLTGCGVNTYSIVARSYKVSESGGIYPHNSFLQKAAETGLLGLFVFLWLIVQFFWVSFQSLKQNKNMLVLGLLSGILAFLVQAFFDNHLYSLQLVVLFWFILGLTIAVINLET